MKKIIPSRYLLISLSLIFILSGCAQFSSKKRTTKKYSADVEMSFEQIEREKALEKYRKLRWTKWQSYSKKADRNKSRNKKKYSSNFRRKTKGRKKITLKPRPYKKVVQKKARVKPSLTSDQLEELKVEIDQNMNYFCMKNRNDSRFSDVKNCNQHTQSALNKCSEKNENTLDRKVLRCIKLNLNLR